MAVQIWSRPTNHERSHDLRDRTLLALRAAVIRLIPLVAFLACSHAASNGDDQPHPDAPISHPDANQPDAIDAPSYRYLCDAPVPAGAPMPIHHATALLMMKGGKWLLADARPYAIMPMPAAAPAKM